MQFSGEVYTVCEALGSISSLEDLVWWHTCEFSTWAVKRESRTQSQVHGVFRAASTIKKPPSTKEEKHQGLVLTSFTISTVGVICCGTLNSCSAVLDAAC